MTSTGLDDKNEHTLADAALAYVARGWRVFPCVPGGKRPLGKLVPHGHRDATSDPARVGQWWAAEPNANVGLPTGEHFDVFDIDGVSPLEALETARSLGDGDMEGPMVSTPRGWHRYAAPTGLGNTVKLGGIPGVDWRGRGGYVVAPPSVSESGGAWDWVENRGPDVPIVPAPRWVLSLFDPRPDSSGGSAGPARYVGHTGYGAAALERELGQLVMAPEGARNDQLNRSAFKLGQLVRARALTAEEVGKSLLSVALRIGLGDTEATATIRSGLAAGIRDPRKVKL